MWDLQCQCIWISAPDYWIIFKQQKSPLIWILCCKYICMCVCGKSQWINFIYFYCQLKLEYLIPGCDHMRTLQWWKNMGFEWEIFWCWPRLAVGRCGWWNRLFPRQLHIVWCMWQSKYNMSEEFYTTAVNGKGFLKMNSEASKNQSSKAIV